MADSVAPEIAEFDRIRSDTRDSADLDLPDADRSTRRTPMVDARGSTLAVGDAVAHPMGEGRVLGPGRGRDFLLIAMVEVVRGERVRGRGTFHRNDVRKL